MGRNLDEDKLAHGLRLHGLRHTDAVLVSTERRWSYQRSVPGCVAVSVAGCVAVSVPGCVAGCVSVLLAVIVTNAAATERCSGAVRRRSGAAPRLRRGRASEEADVLVAQRELGHAAAHLHVAVAVTRQPHSHSAPSAFRW
jgi:hypothetical protein